MFKNKWLNDYFWCNLGIYAHNSRELILSTTTMNSNLKMLDLTLFIIAFITSRIMLKLTQTL